MKRVLFADREARRLGRWGAVKLIRPMRPQPVLTELPEGGQFLAWQQSPKNFLDSIHTSFAHYCPLGKPDDQVRVLETWAPCGDAGAVWYKAGIPLVRGGTELAWMDYPYRLDNEVDPPEEIHWKSGLTMPEWASRLVGRIDEVAICQVSQMTPAEASRCGFEFKAQGWALESFRRWWARAHRDLPWEEAWVWKVEVKRVYEWDEEVDLGRQRLYSHYFPRG